MDQREQWQALMQQLQEMRSRGEYELGISQGKTALKLAENLSSTDLTTTLNNLAGLYKSQQQYDKAEPLYLRALAIRGQKLGRKHPHVATSLNNLAVLCKAQRRFGEAQHLYLQAIEILEQSLGSEHLSVANTLHNLAGLYKSQQQYDAAEPVYQRALAIREQKLGHGHPLVASTLHNLAGLYEAQGRYPEAEPLYRQALLIANQKLEQISSPDNSSLPNQSQVALDLPPATSQNNGSTSNEAVKENRLGHHTADSLYNLAKLCEAQGRYAESEQHYLQALAICERQLGTEHPAVANILNGLAMLCKSQGWYIEAEQHYLHALTIYEQQLGNEHPLVSNSFNNLAELHYAKGCYEEALKHYQSSLICQYNFLRHQLVFVGEQELLLYLQNIKFTLDIILSLVFTYLPDESTACESAFAAVSRAKMLGITTIATRNALLHSDHHAHLQPKFQQIRHLIAQGNELEDNDPARANILKRVREIEVEIDQSALEMMIPEASLIDHQSIALALPTDSTLIEFLKFHPYDFEHQSWGNEHYIALMLPQDQSHAIKMLPLAPVKDIDELVATYRQTINLHNNQDISPEVAAGRLSKKIIFPLTHHLKSFHLVLVPDGTLSHLPFNLLLDEFIVTYLTTSRDLLRISHGKPASASLVVADPDFDNASAQSPPVLSIATEHLAKSDINNLVFPPLQNYGLLGRSIASRLNGKERYEQDATKNSITSTCPHILTILTYGFSLEPTNNTPDPMNRAGLALSGSNADKNNLLLASEIAALDLHSNNLTILTVCGTAPGTIQSGDGIHQIRRAFGIAGAKTTIANLWSVPILVSVVLIERFFDNLQNHKMGKGAALIEAQVYLCTRTRQELKETAAGRRALAELQEANCDDGADYPFARPYFWAAWVCQGETERIEYTTTQRLGVLKISGKAVDVRLKT
jgi:tetratricopeptide (TPR) repeat protein